MPSPPAASGQLDPGGIAALSRNPPSRRAPSFYIPFPNIDRGRLFQGYTPTPPDLFTIECGQSGPRRPYFLCLPVDNRSPGAIARVNDDLIKRQRIGGIHIRSVVMFEGNGCNRAV